MIYLFDNGIKYNSMDWKYFDIVFGEDIDLIKKEGYIKFDEVERLDKFACLGE